jgi:hypothetical protein
VAARLNVDELAPEAVVVVARKGPGIGRRQPFLRMVDAPHDAILRHAAVSRQP